jgi:hypothetical protein
LKSWEIQNFITIKTSLFKVRKKFPIALKWKDMVVNDSYPTVNQTRSVNVTTASGSEISAKPHPYCNSDPEIHGKVISVLSRASVTLFNQPWTFRRVFVQKRRLFRKV